MRYIITFELYFFYICTVLKTFYQVQCTQLRLRLKPEVFFLKM